MPSRSDTELGSSVHLRNPPSFYRFSVSAGAGDDDESELESSLVYECQSISDNSNKRLVAPKQSAADEEVA